MLEMGWWGEESLENPFENILKWKIGKGKSCL